MSNKLDKAKVRIIITDFDHCDTEKPLQMTFSGLITTNIGDSFFDLAYTPAMNIIDLTIHSGNIRHHIYGLIGAGDIALDQFVFEAKNENFTIDDIAEQVQTIIEGLQPTA